jgi:hypothetical protein
LNSFDQRQCTAKKSAFARWVHKTLVIHTVTWPSVGLANPIIIAGGSQIFVRFTDRWPQLVNIIGFIKETIGIWQLIIIIYTCGIISCASSQAIKAYSRFAVPI